jgi:hypothetical protein
MPRPSGKLDSKIRSDNTSGATGIYFRERTQRWIAQLQMHKRRYHLGVFARFEDACLARERAEARLQAQW